MPKIFLLDDKNYGKHIQEDLYGEQGWELNVFNNLKDLLNAILLTKPQLILIPAPEAIRHRRKLKKLLTVFSFIPIAAYGEFGKNIKQSNKNIHRFLSKGYAECITVQTILNKELLLTQIKYLISQGLSKEDIWQKEYSISLSEARNNLYRNIIAGTITAVILLGLIFAFKEKIPPDRTLLPKTFNIPYSNLSGIAISKDGNTLWACNWQAQNIYKHSMKAVRFHSERVQRLCSLPILYTFSFPEKRFTGIAHAEGYIWTLDSYKKKIYKHILDGKLSIISEYSLQCSSPISITSFDKYLLLCDNATNKLYIHKTDESLSIIKEYTLPGKNVIAIFQDNKFLWAVDSEENKIYQCKIEDFELKVDSIFLVPEYEQFKVTAISGDKNYLYFASEKLPKICRYPKKSLEPIE